MSRANLEPKTNHTKGRWCAPATSQSMSAAASLGSESGAERWSVPSAAAARVVAWQARAEPRSREPSPATDQAPVGTPAREWQHTQSVTHHQGQTPYSCLCSGPSGRERYLDTGAGCPKPWEMQPVFWISCSTSSFLRTGVPSAPETCGWLHSIPQETHSRYSCALRMLWSWLPASLS